MCNQDRADDFLRKANRSYSIGNFSEAEQFLLDASRVKNVSHVSQSCIYSHLAALACEQGRFSTAAYWYRKVLAINSHQYPVGSPELKNTIKNYRLLLSMCQNKGQIRDVYGSRKVKLSA